MDAAASLRDLYRYCREKRLADAMALLGDDFKFRTNVPDDPTDPARPRSRAEVTLLAHKFFEEFDILALEPAIIVVGDDGVASARLDVTLRHKKSGKRIETNFLHDWLFSDGKFNELREELDDNWVDFLRNLDTP
jgi:ketosteroid isomerase-like protein